MENDLYFVFTQKKQTNSILTDFHGWQNQNSVDWKRLHSAIYAHTHTHSKKGGQFVESDVWTQALRACIIIGSIEQISLIHRYTVDR